MFSSTLEGRPSDLSENGVRSYMSIRKKEGASNRTINMEVAVFHAVRAVA